MGLGWPFSEQALSQLLWFLQLLRTPPAGNSVPPVSVLELYFAFLFHNGKKRFLSGISDSNAGDHLAVQADKFVKCIQAWQSVTRACRLVATKVGRTRPEVRWQQEYGYPPSPALELDVMVPQWGGVRRYMIEEAGHLSRYAKGPCDSRPWRRWAPGEPESQVDLRGGHLPVVSPLWVPGRRFRSITRPTVIEQERRQVGPFQDPFCRPGTYKWHPYLAYLAECTGGHPCTTSAT